MTTTDADVTHRPASTEHVAWLTRQAVTATYAVDKLASMPIRQYLAEAAEQARQDAFTEALAHALGETVAEAAGHVLAAL